MELLGVIRCVDHVKVEPPVPALDLEVREALFGRSKKFTAPLDTGFAGYLMLPEEDYSALSTAEVPREEFGLYSTMAGPVPVRRARVHVGIGGREVETFVESPLYGGGKLLVGRRVLSIIDVALMGPGARTCLVEQRGKEER